MINAPIPLPSATASLVYLYVGWGVILASLAGTFARKKMLIPAVFLWVGLPLFFSAPEYSPAYWLGLAFQAPSLVSVGLCAGLSAPQHFAPRRPLTFAALASGLGWILLLDSFAVLPLEFYALGFQAGIAGGMVVLLLLISFEPITLIAASALVVYAIFRIPSGNVWDVMLDPLLWFLSQFYIVKTAITRIKRA